MKNTSIVYWISTGLIVLIEGVMPLSTLIFSPEHVNTGTQPLGYPDYFAYTLILFKILGAIVLATPKFHPLLKEWVYAGFTFNLIFAVISHIVVDGNVAYILMPIVVLAILALSYQSYHRLNPVTLEK